MASHIPFVNSKTDLKIADEYYDDSEIVRVSLEDMPAFCDGDHIFRPDYSLWLDPGVDAYHHIFGNDKRPEDKKVDIPEYLKKFHNYKLLGETIFLGKSKSVLKEKIKPFVYNILDECSKYKPKWITVPLLPFCGKIRDVNDTTRNKINFVLSNETSDWKSERHSRVKLILPLVFTHRSQIYGRTEWMKKVKVAESCFKHSRADGLWVVDSSLSDQQGTGSFKDRFESLVNLHEELRKRFSEATIIAGPYWGMNLVLWVRGLADHPAICLGSRYQYHIPGIHYGKKGSQRKTRIALHSLRRWAVTEIALSKWIDHVLQELSPNDPAYGSFADLRSHYAMISKVPEQAKSQTARVYKQWFDKIESNPPSGRALALYQDLSSAFVIGSQLPKLPKDSRPMNPAKVAEQLMLNCL